MTKAEFMKEFERLCDYYNKPTTDKEILLMYYEAVKNTTAEHFKDRVNEIIQVYKFMPKIADFNKKRKSNFEQREYSEDFLESFYDVGVVK